MRVDVVGAGVAGLTAALAVQRRGHQVRVLEQAAALRDTGFGLNLWSNATTPLAALGVDVPGESFDRVLLRYDGQTRAVMPVPAAGRPHVNVDRGQLLRVLASMLAPGTLHFDRHVASASDLLADGADLVVAADGAASGLRPASRPGRQAVSRRPWRVWQAVIDDSPERLDPGVGAVVVGRRRFAGIWQLPDGGMTWFVEDPAIPETATAAEVLDRIGHDDDPLLAGLAGRTQPAAFSRWDARDRWPRRLTGHRLVVIGDAAHPMWPCIGQGACLAIEDAVTLARALDLPSLPTALKHYDSQRIRRVRSRVALAHVACMARRPTPLNAVLAAPPVGRGFGRLTAAALRAVAALPTDSLAE